MKIEEEIGLNDRPLQSDPSNEGRGFEFSEFLGKYKYKEKQPRLPTSAEAMKLIEKMRTFAC